MSSSTKGTFEHQISEAAADAAAGIVVDRHELDHEEGESSLQALCWSLGGTLPYEQGLREFGFAVLSQRSALHALCDHDDVVDLIDSKIELLSEYKLDYPGDYEPDDVAEMQAEITRLEELRDKIQRITS